MASDGPWSDEERRIADFLRGIFPRWLFGKSGDEILHMLAKVGGVTLDAVRFLVDQTYVTRATLPFLLEHARSKGTRQQYGETTEALRERLKRPFGVVDKITLLAKANAILAAHGIAGTARGVALPLNGAAVGYSYTDRGYRVSPTNRPWARVLILPYGTTDAAKAACAEMLREDAAAGFTDVIEVRKVP